MTASACSAFRITTIAVLGAMCGLVSPPTLAGHEVADAAMDRDAQRIERLLRGHADVNGTQPDGTTALHWAAHAGDAALALRLLKAGANANATTENGITPLGLASETGSAAVVSLLLKAGATVNKPFTNGETPLMVAARTGNVAVLNLLLDSGAEIDQQEKLRGTTALMWAAANHNTAAARLLISRGANVAARSGTAPATRRPYLAPPGRDRLQEFIDGRGLLAPVNVDTPEKKQRLAAEIAATRRELARFPAPETAAANGGSQGTKPPAKPGAKRAGGLTPLLFAVRENDVDTAQVLLDAGADVNQPSEFGWTPLLVATHNRDYKLASWLLAHGANPNLANEGGWTPLYLATDNRNIEGGDYPTRRPDMDHLDYLRQLLAKGANPNLRMRSSTETRTIFTHQWLYEEGATPFLRAAQSGDLALMKLLLEHGADPQIPTEHNVTPLMVASGIGWVEGVTFEWSPTQTLEAVKLLLEHGADVNAHDNVDGRTALMGAAHKGRNDVIELLVAHGADLAARDIGSRDSVYTLAGVVWQAIDYADGLVRIGVQSSIAHPATANLLRKLMKERNLATPPEGRALESICITELCQ